MVLRKLDELGIGYESAPGEFQEDKPTLVMIHGAGGRSQIWNNQTHTLKDELNLVALDLPGHGNTPGPAMKEIRKYAEWSADVLKGVFSASFFLMGHSMGGAIVQEIAVLNPNMIKGVILAGTGARLKVAPVFLEWLKKEFEETVDKIIGYAYASHTDKSIISEGARILKEAGPEVVHGDFLACDLHDRRDDLWEGDPRCLILCGEEDKLTPPALSREIHEDIQGSELKVLPSCGHMLMIECPEVFNECILEFIRHGALEDF